MEQVAQAELLGTAPGKTNLKLGVVIKPVIPAWGQG